MGWLKLMQLSKQKRNVFLSGRKLADKAQKIINAVYLVFQIGNNIFNVVQVEPGPFTSD